MLPQQNRINLPHDFSCVLRRGRQIRGHDFIIYILKSSQKPALIRAGFIVSKKVGNSVVRNKVKRKLREIVHSFINEVEKDPVFSDNLGSYDIVIRALPKSAHTPYADFKKSFDHSIQSFFSQEKIAGTYSKTRKHS